MPYYTLISRPKPKRGWTPAPWAVQFGAHDRADVVAERLDIRNADRAAGEVREYRIIRTASMRQALIRDVLDRLTREDAPRQPQAQGEAA